MLLISFVQIYIINKYLFIQVVAHSDGTYRLVENRVIEIQIIRLVGKKKKLRPNELLSENCCWFDYITLDCTNLDRSLEIFFCFLFISKWILTKVKQREAAYIRVNKRSTYFLFSLLPPPTPPVCKQFSAHPPSHPPHTLPL